MKYSVKLSLPEADICYGFHVKQYPDCLKQLLVVAGGREPESSWLKKVAEARSVFCADKGAEYCVKNGIGVDFLCGDKDSAASELYDLLSEAGAEVSVYPSAKDATDLQLLLDKLPCGTVVATGVFGGRFDHLFSCVYSLLQCKKGRRLLVLADDKELLVLLEAGDEVEITVKAETVLAVSLLPLCPAAVVTLKGVRWPLEETELEQLYPYAVSNELSGDKGVCCSLKAGLLGLYFAWK